MGITADVERCVACAMCMLYCSHRRTGGFNVRRAELEVVQGPEGDPTALRFLLDCQDTPARGCEGIPPCVEACSYDALTFEEAAPCSG